MNGYTFHYENGRRAVRDMLCFDNDKNAVDYAVALAKTKKREIVLRWHTPTWYNDANCIVGWYVPRDDGAIVDIYNATVYA